MFTSTELSKALIDHSDSSDCEAGVKVTKKDIENAKNEVKIKLPDIKYDFIEENTKLAAKVKHLKEISVFCRNLETGHK